uniref:Uncharacterized protein n=1 Tax=Timema cristinae TaxID=61476 RepID=A0A7R9CL23_TIMCR|nr:unnamed protein product [Timema cristinae]
MKETLETELRDEPTSRHRKMSKFEGVTTALISRKKEGRKWKSATRDKMHRRRSKLEEEIRQDEEGSVAEEEDVVTSTGDRQTTETLVPTTIEIFQLWEQGNVPKLKTCRLTGNFRLPDENATIVFDNGSKYVGRISRKQMEGNGEFYFTNGAFYKVKSPRNTPPLVLKGNFEAGEMSGVGYIEWPDLSWYEGEVYCGYRHGYGMFVSSCHKVAYLGQWRMGQKHGKGLILYDDQKEDLYDGDWVAGERQGYGLRVYPNGGRYIGSWVNGKRVGPGTMVWPEAHLYRGEWRAGVMEGYGEYTWGAFLNKQLVFPVENIYRGSWINGKRNGPGVLEVGGAASIEGHWKDNLKHGAGSLICGNGHVLRSDNLFKDDHLVKKESSNFPKDKDEVKPSAEVKKPRKRFTKETKAKSLQKTWVKKASTHDITITSDKKDQPHKKTISSATSEDKYLLDTRSIPIHASCHKIDISYHLDRWESFGKVKSCNQSCEFYGKSYDIADSAQGLTYSGGCYVHDMEGVSEREFEEKWLDHAISANVLYLHQVYTRYSQVACDEQPNFSTALVRLMLWQLYRDCGIHTKGVSLIQLDKMLAKNPIALIEFPHHPLELLHFWQFLHSLLDVSWVLYASQGVGYLDTRGVLGSALYKLVMDDVMPHAYNHTGSVLFGHRDVLPLTAVYLLYKSLGEPLSARQFLLYSCGLRNAPPLPESSPPCGSNAVAVGGELMYLPEGSSPHRPLEGPRIGVGPTQVVTCLSQLCPGIKGEQGIIVDMEYPLTFLEFYEVLLLVEEWGIRKEADRNTRLATIAAQKLIYETTHGGATSLDMRSTSVVSSRGSRRKKKKDN